MLDPPAWWPFEGYAGKPGAVDVLLLATTGVIPWYSAIGGYIVPALIGNLIGGVAIVAVVNHAQVVS